MAKPGLQSMMRSNNVKQMAKIFLQIFAFIAFFGVSYSTSYSNINLLHLIFSGFLAAPLIWLCIVDLDRFEFPDLSVIWIALGGLLFQFFTGWNAVLWGLVSGVIVLLVLYLISRIAERLTNKQALGLGDVKLFGASAVWVGLQGISSVVLLASLSGILFVGVPPPGIPPVRPPQQ